eukprot:jgi/Orpsp1_1/1180330/evm.model.c7180000072966.1
MVQSAKTISFQVFNCDWFETAHSNENSQNKNKHNSINNQNNNNNSINNISINKQNKNKSIDNQYKNDIINNEDVIINVDNDNNNSSKNHISSNNNIDNSKNEVNSQNSVTNKNKQLTINNNNTIISQNESNSDLNDENNYDILQLIHSLENQFEKLQIHDNYSTQQILPSTNNNNDNNKNHNSAINVLNNISKMYDNIQHLNNISDSEFVIDVSNKEHDKNDTQTKEPIPSDSSIKIPANYQEAINNKYSEYWIEAMKEELYNLYRNNTMTILDKLPNDVNLITTKWVFSVKRDTIASNFKWNVTQLDIKSAYLNAPLDKDIYTTIPEGDEYFGKGYWLLNKALYGLKQSGRQWFKTISSFLRNFGFQQSNVEQCLFYYTKNNKT